MLRYIIEALQASGRIGQIVVVGPEDAFKEALGDLDVIIVPQKRSLTENGWEGFLHTLPEYHVSKRLTPDLMDKYRDKYVLGLSGDIPLLGPGEINEFISRCDMAKYDYIAGITSEAILDHFGPRKGRPGIKMATFHTRDGNFRQNNLHMGRPFAFMQELDLMLNVYEYRYQKEPLNIIRTLIEILRLGPGRIGHTLSLYMLMQISSGFYALGMEKIARVFCYPVTRQRLERQVSALMKARCRTVETTIGGAALDVDNEKDFLTLSVMFRDWVQQIETM